MTQALTIEVTDAMAVFCDRLVAGDTPTAAARAAGYERPAETGALLIRHPNVRKALAERAAAAVECELVPLSLRVARDILEDTNPKAVAVRAKLVLGILDRAAKQREAEEDDPTRSLAKLSADDLAALVAKGIAAQEQEARTIDVTPTVGRNDGPIILKDVANTSA